MGKVGTGFSMSLDGFVARPNDDIGPLFDWMSLGDTSVELSSGSSDFELNVSEKAAESFEETMSTTGALVAGRKLFDVTGGWGGRHPLNVPVFVVTHTVPEEWVKANEGSPFTFVTDGLKSALAQAQTVAGEKAVAIASTTIAQQLLKAGLLDEIHIDLVPVLLGEGIRLFDRLGADTIPLEIVSVEPDRGVTHVTYRVVK